MNEHYLYLLIDFLSLLFPLAFSFHPRNQFYKHFRSVWPSLLIPALLFIMWDMLFTDIGVWGFNPAYITGVKIFNLPVEEVLFFFCVPYACLFTYFSFSVLLPRSISSARAGTYIAYAITALMLVVGLIFFSRLYTSVTFLALGIFLIFLLVRKPQYLGRFFFCFVVILVPFFIVNGILTGTGIPDPIVWYNDHENLGIRMGTIPIEDTFYGMLLILMNVSIFEKLEKKKASSV